MQVIEALCSLVLEPHDHFHISHDRVMPAHVSILDLCGTTDNAEGSCKDFEAPLPPELRRKLLSAAMGELLECQRQLILWRFIWATFWHRDERAIRKPYWRLRERQRFYDGVRVAELLVAIRQRLIGQECPDLSEGWWEAMKLRHSLKRAMHIASVITGDITAIEELLKPEVPHKDKGAQKWPPGPYAGKTRWLPSQRRTPSWQAGYNAACLYAALACSEENKKSQNEESKRTLMVLRCLDRVVNDRLCEMERPWDWISIDPDLYSLKDKSTKFREFLDHQKRKDYPKATPKLHSHWHLGRSERAQNGLLVSLSWWPANNKSAGA